MKENTRYLFFAIPSIAYVLVFAFLPSAGAIYGSLINSQGKFTLNNFRELLFFNIGDSIVNTIIVTAGALLIQLVLGFLVAFVLAREFRGRRALSVLFIIPMGVATVVSAIAFSFIFQADGGYANSFLTSLLHLQPVNWYGSPISSLLVVMVADSWKNTPIVALILLAGLTSIPRDLYYAAALDGAGSVRRFIHVTLPNMKKFIVIALVVRGVSEFNIFALPLILIGDHPSLLTTLTYDLYSTSSLGIADAGAVVLLAFITVFILLNLMLTREGR